MMSSARANSPPRACFLRQHAQIVFAPFVGKPFKGYCLLWHRDHCSHPSPRARALGGDGACYATLMKNALELITREVEITPLLEMFSCIVREKKKPVKFAQFPPSIPE